MADVNPGVVAVVVTHKRNAELARLLDALASSTQLLLGCVISDHAPDGSSLKLAEGRPFRCDVLEDGKNPGPGVGWANAATHARKVFGHALTALWYLDDDVLPSRDALHTLLEEMGEAEAIAPLLEDEHGHLWGFPEPVDKGQRRIIRQAKEPHDARRLLGEEALPFCWCTGACVLVRAAAMDRVGLHRGDFFLLGEDLEYAMRLASGDKAVFTCKVSVPHLPPAPKDAKSALRGDYVKFCSLLQNLSYLSFHSPYSRHMKQYLPGNFRRFFRTHGWTARSLRDALVCLTQGAVAGRPAGTRRNAIIQSGRVRYGD